MNSRIFLILLVSVSVFLAGCVRQQSEVAAKLGYMKSVKVEAGPYQLHYAHDGTNDFVLLAEGNWDILSRYTGDGTGVYLDGQPFISFKRSADGSVTDLQMNVFDKDGKVKFTLIDTNADGQWDAKIDFVTGKAYVWKGGSWVQR